MAAPLTDKQRRVGWDFRLREQSRLADPYTALSGVHRDGGKLTDAWLATTTADAGETRRLISMLKDLTGSGVYGTQNLEGNEEEQATWEMEVYADEVAHGVKFTTFGYKAFLESPWKFYAKVNTQLGIWHAKNEGRRIREALCEKLDYALKSTNSNDTSYRADRYPHPNILVVQGNTVARPTYSATLATYANAVNTAVSSIAHPTSISFLDMLSEYVTQELVLEPLYLDGRAVYGLVVPTHTLTLMRGLLRDVEKYTMPKSSGIQVSGKLWGNFLILEDPRAPRVAVTSSSLTFGYNGVSDTRPSAANATPDVGAILGAEAIIEFVADPLRYRENLKNYDRDKGIGAFRINGYNRVDYDANAGTNSNTRRNTSSALVLFKSN